MSAIPISGPTGLGLMSLTWRPDKLDYQQCFDVINAALDKGITFFNSGEFYGPPTDPNANLKLLQAYFKKYPENRSKMTICVKGAVNLKTIAPDTSKENLKKSVENIASYFPGGTFDIFEPARMDLVHPIEEVVENLAEFVKSGIIKGISLSEVSGETIRKASVIHPISYVEEEFSMMETALLGNGINDACRDLGIPIVAYSPLGRGYLTGSIRTMEDIPEGDIRRFMGRWNSDEVLKANFGIVQAVLDLSDTKKCTPAQVALGWIRKHNDFPDKYTHYIPIPSSSTMAKFHDNTTVVELTDKEFAELNKKLSAVEVAGSRYNAMADKYLQV